MTLRIAPMTERDKRTLIGSIQDWKDVYTRVLDDRLAKLIYMQLAAQGVTFTENPAMQIFYPFPADVTQCRVTLPWEQSTIILHLVGLDA